MAQTVCPGLHPPCPWPEPVKELPVDGLTLPEGWTLIQVLSGDGAIARDRYYNEGNQFGQVPPSAFPGARFPLVLQSPTGTIVVRVGAYPHTHWYQWAAISDDRQRLFSFLKRRSERELERELVDPDDERLCSALNACQTYFGIREDPIKTLNQTVQDASICELLGFAVAKDSEFDKTK
jgi:hypothetical protein